MKIINIIIGLLLVALPCVLTWLFFYQEWNVPFKALLSVIVWIVFLVFLNISIKGKDRD